MRRSIAAGGLIAAAGLTGSLLIAPALAASDGSTTTTTTVVRHRWQALEDALAGLVSDKTLTQAQADKVAATLDAKLPRHRGPGGPAGLGRGVRGPGHLPPADVAKALGVTPQELRSQLRAGRTLAQIGAAQGLSKATVVDRLVAAATARLTAAVKDGRLTQAQADALRPRLTARITEQVDRVPGRHRPEPADRADEPGGGTATPSGYTGTT